MTSFYSSKCFTSTFYLYLNIAQSYIPAAVLLVWSILVSSVSTAGSAGPLIALCCADEGKQRRPPPQSHCWKKSRPRVK